MCQRGEREREKERRKERERGAERERKGTTDATHLKQLLQFQFQLCKYFFIKRINKCVATEGGQGIKGA